MFKNFIFQIVGTLIAISVLAYLALHTISSFENEIEVKNAYSTTMDLTYDSTAYIFRDEAIITSEKNGKAAYEIENGKKISVNQKVASIFSNDGNMEVQNKIKALEKEIVYLESVVNKAKFSTPSITDLDKNLNERLQYVSSYALMGDLRNALNIADESVYDLDLKYCILKGTSAHEKLIEELKSEVKTLSSSSMSNSSSVYSPYSGYFYNEADGYESIFNIDAIKDLSAQSFEDLENAQATQSNNVGKVCKNSKWYIAFRLKNDAAIQISAGEKYPVFFSSCGKSINMTFEKRIDSSDENEKIVVLSTNTIYKDFNISRKQNVSITVATYTGIAFPAKAVHIDFDSTGASKAGVYILDETVVKFKTFTKLMEKNGYVLCAFHDQKNIAAISEEKVSLYDTVIVEGTNLYNNKVIKNVLKVK